MPFLAAVATTPAPKDGSVSLVSEGVYPESTSSAAYSEPKWVWLFQLESPRIFVKGRSVNGCTHHSSPLLTYKTICWPGLAPVTPPSIVASLSRPPASAAGTVLIVTVGVQLGDHVRQPPNTRRTTNMESCHCPVTRLRR